LVGVGTMTATPLISSLVSIACSPFSLPCPEVRPLLTQELKKIHLL
jgi:hypothetical protein